MGGGRSKVDILSGDKRRRGGEREEGSWREKEELGQVWHCLLFIPCIIWEPNPGPKAGQEGSSRTAAKVLCSVFSTLCLPPAEFLSVYRITHPTQPAVIDGSGCSSLRGVFKECTPLLGDCLVSTHFPTSIFSLSFHWL